MGKPRYWGKNIVIDGSWLATDKGSRARTRAPQQYGLDKVWGYQDYVHRTLWTIYVATQTGKALLDSINQIPSKRVRIVPMTFGNVNQNARAQTPWKSCDTTGYSEDGWPRECDGSGSDVRVQYEPHTWAGWDTRNGYDPHRDRNARDVLVHELFHALQYMTATTVPDSTPQLVADGWGNYKEFHACLVENIYRSETGRTRGIRGDHGLVHTRLSAKLWGAELVAHDLAFYKRYSFEIDKLDFAINLHSFLRRMQNPANFPARVWNPIRAGWVDTLAQSMPDPALPLSR